MNMNIQNRKIIIFQYTIKRKLFLSIFAAVLCLCHLKLDMQAAYPENIGIITSDTNIYAAADKDSACLGSIQKNSRVDIVSVLSHFVLIAHNGQYAYVPGSAIAIDKTYSYLGDRIPYNSPYGILITEGNLYRKAPDTLMQAYMAVPEKVRNAFESNGFHIKMTEWDVQQEAYAPYGGYHGYGQIQAVLDYEKKMLFVNDEYPNSVIHEMGHFVNNYLHLYSSRPENRKMYCSEASKISSYAETNDKEFFAEAFRLYITNSQILKLISPDTYNMVDASIALFLLENAYISH